MDKRSKVGDLVTGLIYGVIIILFCLGIMQIVDSDNFFLPLVLLIDLILVILSFIKKRAYLGMGIILPPVIIYLLINQACSGFLS